MKYKSALFTLMLATHYTPVFAEDTAQPEHQAQTASETSEKPSGTFGMGFTTLTGTQATTNRPSLTTLFSLSEQNLLQIYFSIPTTNPFTVGIGALFKHTVFGNHETGFHLGLGATGGMITAYGTSNVSFGSASGVIGFHFRFHDLKQISFHIDGGPTYSLQNTAQFPSNFTVDAFSSNLGLSVIYAFDSPVVK